MNILVINSGSSSIKYKFFRMPQRKLLAEGKIEHIGEKGSDVQDHKAGLKLILNKINSVDAVGHRVVHGAESFKKPVLINQPVIRKIRECCSIAPLHNPANLAGILACNKLLQGVKQVAVFDTAFHQSLPDYAYIYGLPYEYYTKFGIRKYGFHGTSHEYVAHEAAHALKQHINQLKIITCHLGNGCSITAVERGKSIDTSMGFTPLEGLVMGTRCGDIDPALITHIMKKKRLDIAAMDKLLNKESGLKGISGVSNDMRLLEEKSRQGNKRARLALDIFVYRIRKYIGAYTAIMAGCDALVFTGGIGENQKGIRARIAKNIFKYLRKKPKIMVIPTNEELMIAKQTYQLINDVIPTPVFTGVNSSGNLTDSRLRGNDAKRRGNDKCKNEDEIMKKAVMIISHQGFRDEELLDTKAVLEENGIEVKVASTELSEARGKLGAKIMPDMLFKDVKLEEFDALIFVGGPGSTQYWLDPFAHKLLKEAVSSGKVSAGICAAAVTLAHAGILKGRRATVFSGDAQELINHGANYTAKPVEKDGKIITADGPASARGFGQAIVEVLKSS